MHSPWVRRLLSELGHEVIVAHARNLRLIGEAGGKTIGWMRRPWRAWPRSASQQRARAAAVARRLASELSSRPMCEMEKLSERASFRQIQWSE
jgi:hypothetical protein